MPMSMENFGLMTTAENWSTWREACVRST